MVPNVSERGPESITFHKFNLPVKLSGPSARILPRVDLHLYRDPVLRYYRSLNNFRFINLLRAVKNDENRPCQDSNVRLSYLARPECRNGCVARVSSTSTSYLPVLISYSSPYYCRYGIFGGVFCSSAFNSVTVVVLGFLSSLIKVFFVMGPLGSSHRTLPNSTSNKSCRRLCAR